MFTVSTIDTIDISVEWILRTALDPLDNICILNQKEVSLGLGHQTYLHTVIMCMHSITEQI